MKQTIRLALAIFAALPATRGVAAEATAATASAATAPPQTAAARSGQTVSPLLEQALAGPLREVQEIVFCTRRPYDDPHWYANIGYYCDDEQQKAYTGNGKSDVGRLYGWNVRSKQLRVLLDAHGGSIRDPQVHYDARKILFSYRTAGTDFYHLYEINVDGTGLRQLTSGEFDDYEPTYLPDGDIVFVSTRCKRWVNCWKTQVGTMYRCRADGSHLECISANTEHDNTPWMMPDGRLLYTRWEYVDRSQVEFHHLWAMNPDGTGQAVFFGNLHPNIVMIDAKPVPGTDQVLASFSPGHGVNEHAGIATLVTSAKGPDDKTAAVPLHKGRLTKDPYPLSATCIVAARDNEIVLLNGKGMVEVIYRHAGEGTVHEPRPILPRPRERIIERKSRSSDAFGHMVLADVYNSRNLPGVARGEIKKLLILESLPKPVNFSGGPDLVSWLGTFTLERVVGTVPVEDDGSAFFEVPAGRQLFFVALDERDLSVKRMQSFTTVMPGEVLSCVGCHEHRVKTPENKSHGTLAATRRAPSKIQRFEGLPDVLDFTRDIQPILDRHCVRCHNPDQRDGQVNLAGDLGPTWSHSFFSLFAHRQVADGRNGLGNQPPRTIGSSASPLLQKVAGGHYAVKATARDWRTLWLWVESGAPYAGSYAGLRNEHEQNLASQSSGAVFHDAATLLQRRCYHCHNATTTRVHEEIRLPFDYEKRRQNKAGLARPTAAYERIVVEDDPIARFSANILLNLTRPEKSALLLGPLAREAGGWGSCGAVFQDRGDADYRVLLTVLQKAKAAIDVQPRYATPGFVPNRQYIRELKKYGVLPESFDPARQRLDYFEADQRYWRSLWPPATFSAAK